MHPSFVRFTPAKQERAQETPGASRTRSLACEVEGAHERSHHRFSRIARRFLRNGFNGLWRALPGDRLFCHRHRRKTFRRLDFSVEKSGPRDFAVHVRRPRLARRSCPPHPAPYVRDDSRNAPLVGAGRQSSIAVSSKPKSEIFFVKGLDSPNHVETT